MKFFLLALVVGWTVQAAAAKTVPVPEKQELVFVLPVKGPIDKGMLIVFRRAFRQVETLKPKAVILEMNTPGGALKETREIIEWIRSTRKKGCPVYAFVNPDALSAGAMICMATEGIYMMEQATIGSAMPIAISPFSGGVQQLPDDVKEKMLSAVRGMVRSLAQENGFREEVAIAMVDPGHPDLDYPGVLHCPKGEILNLTARQAIALPADSRQPVLARAMVSSLEAVQVLTGLENCRRIYFQEEKAERLARWITSVGPLLLALGALGLWIEFKTPGFGIFGIGGICLLGVYFFGHYVAGLAGMEELALVILGIVLLAAEIFVIPGFGIAGIAGILCILLGGGMAVVPLLPDGAQPLPGIPPLAYSEYFPEIIRSLMLTLAGVFLGAWLLARILPKTRIYHNVIMEDHLETGNGMQMNHPMIGQKGVTRTYLRPAGVVVLDGKRHDALSDGEFIPPGIPVEVTGWENASLMVRKCLQKTETGQKESC